MAATTSDGRPLLPNRFMANRMLEILRENEILYEDGKRDDKGHLGGMLGAG